MNSAFKKRDKLDILKSRLKINMEELRELNRELTDYTGFDPKDISELQALVNMMILKADKYNGNQISTR